MVSQADIDKKVMVNSQERHFAGYAHQRPEQEDEQERLDAFHYLLGFMPPWVMRSHSSRVRFQRRWLHSQ